MAGYRLSAQVIKRSDGRSVVAAAAYRASERLHDARTDLAHDYSRKGGTLHAEIIAPQASPDWMRDRAQLWNAVEDGERRKDAQLAREVQLSLPHELTQEQRVELVRGFVAEQFVERGMVADIAIHAPNPDGDERNHHAHVLLTMRTLTPEGFGAKCRDWNSRDIVTEWREQWATHQNRTLERHGHKERVDHRSLEAQGIDREPQAHQGTASTSMKRRGKPSRIASENAQRQQRNIARAEAHAQRALVLAQSIEAKRTEERAVRDHEATREAVTAEWQKRRISLKVEQRNRNATMKATISAELSAIDSRLYQSRGVKKVLRAVFGQQKADTASRERLQRTLAVVEQHEKREVARLDKRYALERKELKSREVQHRTEPAMRSSWGRASSPSNDNERELEERKGWGRYATRSPGRKPS